MEGRPEAATPPPRVPPSPWELLSGGDAGGMGVQGEGGRRGALACPVLRTLLGAVRFFHLTDRIDCALLGAHNLTASASNTVLHPVLRSVFCLRAEYGVRKRRERGSIRARLLSWRRVALASVLQGVASSHFAGRCRFGEHDAAGMERRGYPACAAVCTYPGGLPVVEWNAG